MAMSNCDGCWETPCVCENSTGYRHLSTNELIKIRDGLSKLIDARTKDGIDPTKRHIPAGLR